MDERSLVSSDDCIVFRLVGRRKDARSLETHEEGGLFSRPREQRGDRGSERDRDDEGAEEEALVW
jgi:hypothetical protein